ncbi:MAG: aminotransferase class V-fold PLP-dependent enzyme [Terriglobia bacterium]
MPPVPTERRRFLQLAAAAGLVPVMRAFAAELDGLALPELAASDFAHLREAYLLDPEVTYLNHGSMGTIPRAVQQARARTLDLCESNPWLYMWGGQWEEPREEVRRKAAAFLGYDAGEIALTHNTTEAFNLLAHGLPLGPGDEVVFSSLNHPGASVCWHHRAGARGFRVKPFDFPVAEVPRLTRDDVLDIYDRQLSARTRVLVFPHIDNIVGLRHPMRDLTRLAHERGVEFVAVDAAQAVGMIPANPRQAGVDLYATSPHKWLQAPKGLGLAYIRKEIQPVLRPLWVTWGQERWKGTVRIFEDYGTRNLAEVLTLGHAIDFQQRIDALARQQRLRALWTFARKTAAETGAVWRSPTSWELAASLYAVEVKGKDSSKLFEALWQNHKIVFRPFNTQGLNVSRLSPNLFTSEDELARFFEFAARAAAS